MCLVVHLRPLKSLISPWLQQISNSRDSSRAALHQSLRAALETLDQLPSLLSGSRRSVAASLGEIRGQL